MAQTDTDQPMARVGRPSAVRLLGRRLYDSTVRPLLPRKWGVLNGVAVRSFRLFDMMDCQPQHKAGLLGAIREEVGPGDTVVDIALGRGISAVVAARQGDHVHSFEASEEMIRMGRETVAHNAVAEDVTIHHATVEAAGDLFGGGVAEAIAVADLPDADVWVLDCEGAEVPILEAVDAPPATCIVETHPAHDASMPVVYGLLGDHYASIDQRQLDAGADAKKQVLVATDRTRQATDD